MLNSVILSLIIISRGAAVTIATLSVLWSTPSYPNGPPATTLITKSGMKILLCFLVLLKSMVIILGLRPWLKPTILVSPHTLLPCIQRNGT